MFDFATRDFFRCVDIFVFAFVLATLAPEKKCRGARDLSVVAVLAPYDPRRSQLMKKNENREIDQMSKKVCKGSVKGL